MESKKIEKPIYFNVLRVICMLPVLIWPVIFFDSLFMADNPNTNPIIVYGTIIIINAYPLYLIGIILLSNRLYFKYKILAIVLLLIPVLFFGSYSYFILL